MSKDFTTEAALYTHHQYIAGFLMESFRSRCNLLVRDYDPELNKDNVLARMLEHKEAIISHLSWASLF
jgi:photosystem I P700 chlorophyll a apoprotein A2